MDLGTFNASSVHSRPFYVDPSNCPEAAAALAATLPVLSFYASMALLAALSSLALLFSSSFVSVSRKASATASLWESRVARWGSVGARVMALACWVKVRAARAAERKRVVRILGVGVGEESLGFFLL